MHDRVKIHEKVDTEIVEILSKVMLSYITKLSQLPVPPKNKKNRSRISQPQKVKHFITAII